MGTGKSLKRAKKIRAKKSQEREEESLGTMSAFHWTKFSGLKFRIFHATNGTVFSGSKFGAKTEDSFTFVYLLSGCSMDDAEVKINDVLGEGDNTTYNLS